MIAAAQVDANKIGLPVTLPFLLGPVFRACLESTHTILLILAILRYVVHFCMHAFVHQFVHLLASILMQTFSCAIPLLASLVHFLLRKA